MSRKKNVDYQSYIDNIWLNGYSDETRGRFGQTARELGGQGENPHLLFEINDKDTEKAFRTILQSQNNGGEIAVFKQGDMLIINGHGTKRSGKLIHHGKTCNPQTIISQLENSGMISNDIKEIFTLNCYGGKQSSFTTKSGIKVQSAHTSTNPIIGKLGYQVDNDIATKIYMGISLQNGDINDAFKNAVLRNQNERISLHTSPQEITDLINEAVNRALYDTDENGQMFMRQAAPSEDIKSNQPIETVEFVNDTSDSMTPSFIDENGNIKDEYIINNKNPKKKYKAIRGPRLKEKINESSPVDIPKIQTQQDIVDEVVKKTKSNMVVKPVSNAGQESIEKVAKSIPSGGAGKYVALALGALAVTSAISNSNKKKEGPIQTRRSFNEKTRMTYDVPINDPQAMQMAQAMSQYRYGTRLPGFN